ncbi:hypothetical protein J2Z83_003886 [Virgibacillus natechei]|uniref:PD-(D/E)XK endonuclease-like domain-containing protein n=1 Tax=Virgibacillus natechei TaxID=1216297 RepID=A0ABS4ILA8_9BACI|nr:PD-(D/E)XK nuclease family protein [Virgibacillus natechei]MBP1971731.1 hypothetical protein [Virgibacillus natechei]UZD12273.1 PD-(D/E)XK nuclease family protein [Virgibacillus natechei]
MYTETCPHCGANLIEDAWEDITETEDGGIEIDAYPALICEEKCGYMKRIELVPEVIAQQGEDRLLLAYPNQEGRIFDVGEALLHPPVHVEELTALENWEDYTGNHDIEKLLEIARDIRVADIDTPNLFEFATSELSQDAFLCWFMSWSEKPYRSLDRSLHEAAIDFLAVIFNRHNIPVPDIKSIKIKRQFKELDILAIINDTYAVLIEDKTNTKNHSNQLVRYRKAVEKAFPELIQLPIYYKIADQSHYRSVEKACYVPFKRRMMLEVLKRGKANGVKNPIFLDYYRHLQKLEDSIAAFRKKPITTWGANQWQGFYQEVQKHIDGGWGKVSNPRKGFWGFWCSSLRNGWYLQLEQDKLCIKIKIEGEANKRARRQAAMKEVLRESNEQNLKLQKPARLGNGKTMTIAQRKDYIQTNEEGIIDLKRTIEELKRY